MTLGRLRWIPGIESAILALVGALPMLAGSELPGPTSATAMSVSQPVALLEATQKSVAAVFERGVGVGGMRLRFSLNPSNVGVSWLLAL
jgi:hypothetical protein